MKNKILSLASQEELAPMSMNENGTFEGGFSVLKTSEMSQIQGGVDNKDNNRCINNLECRKNGVCENNQSCVGNNTCIGYITKPNQCIGG